jgi:hypothetical protein
MYDPSKDRLPRATPRTESPISDGYQVTAAMVSDSADLPTYAQSLRVWNGTNGTIRLRVTLMRTEDDTSAGAVAIDCPPGISWEPVRVRRIWSAGSTGLVAALGAGTASVVAGTL